MATTMRLVGAVADRERAEGAMAEPQFVELVLELAGTEMVGVPYWANSALLLAAAGIPTVLFGPPA